MSRIKIKNFGPIKEGFDSPDGFMDIRKITTFIGDQGSGKSTVAKLISTLTWIEKALTRGDRNEKYFEGKNRFRNQYLTYHRLENYFTIDKSKLTSIKGFSRISEIVYEGDSCIFNFYNGKFCVEKIKKTNQYQLPQIMYVPAERNFIATVKEGETFNLQLDSLKEFINNYNDALSSMNEPVHLPIGDVEVAYNKFSKTVYLEGKGYKIKLLEASSGFHSLVPLYLTSRFLSNTVRPDKVGVSNMTSDQRERFRMEMQSINETPGLTEEQKRIARSEIGKKFNKTAFINIVEEPEQNLYPHSQREMLHSLLEFNNDKASNKLILTTHSPYIINYLTLAVEAYSLNEKIQNSKKKLVLGSKLDKIVPLKSIVNSEDLIIYELDNMGNIMKLRSSHGLPSDENQLNEELGKSNELFAQLLEIQQQL